MIPAPKPAPRIECPAVMAAMHQLIHGCEYCRRPFPHRFLEVHHIKSRGAGGSDHPHNLIMLDRWHHKEAGRRRIDPDFLSVIARARAATPIGVALINVFLTSSGE